MAQKYDILPVHKLKTYIYGCADVLNEEWPRNRTARVHMLEKSNDELPYNLALIETNERKEREFDINNAGGSDVIDHDDVTCSEENPVIGHSRLCKVYNVDNACFIESVVIRKDRRGKGLGRKLMEETEQVAVSLGFRVAYLTTRDKQDFYGHLGYQFCEPIISLGSASKLLSDDHFQCLFGKCKPNTSPSTETKCSSSQQNSNSFISPSPTNLPSNKELPPSLSTQNATDEKSSKRIPCAPPPPAPPPPPPPPKMTSSAKGSGQNEESELQVQGTVYWMKKQLV